MIDENKEKKKILVIYGSSEYPTRKTVQSFLFSFQNYSEHQVYYHNYFFYKTPLINNLPEFDIVIFHHSIATPWNKDTYRKRIERFKKWGFKSQYKIAFFQDEYFNSQYSCQFINELAIDKVFSVAPPSEWKKIYRDVDFNKVDFEHILTGYIDKDDLPVNWQEIKNRQRPIDIGYRTDWNKNLVRTGSFGYLKYEIANVFLRELAQKNFNVDISASRKDFKKGKDWANFLLDCRFILGAESGSGLLDYDGSIEKKVEQFMKVNPNSDFNTIKNSCFVDEDNNLALKAISPRHLEAMSYGCCQVLIEGHYNGILQPNAHYIPVKSDFSNISEVIKKINDETLRQQIVENCYRDIVTNQDYHYKSLVRQVFSVRTNATAKSIPDFFMYSCNRFLDTFSWMMAFFYCRLVR